MTTGLKLVDTRRSPKFISSRRLESILGARVSPDFALNSYVSFLTGSMRPQSHFERRRNQRISTPTELWASCKIDDRRITLRVKDFSVSGALFVTEEAIRVGTRLELLFSVPEGEIRVLAVVRSSTPSRGIGVEFVGMDSRAFEFVLKLVKRLLA
jgi:hypothetical protein